MSTRNVGNGTDVERMTAAIHNAIFAENPVTRHVCQQIVARKLIERTAEPQDAGQEGGK